MQTTVIYYYIMVDDEPCDIGCWVVRHNSGILSIRVQLEWAIKAYLQTDKGKAIAKENGGDFDWGDAVIHIPNEHWAKHGIRDIGPLSDFLRFGSYQFVHHDDNFYDEEEEENDDA